MFAEWSAECSADDPVLVVPWKDPDGPAQFIDLRTDPYELHAVAEAEDQPPLLQALRALNATRSPVFTAKCDVWIIAADELDPLRLDLDADEADSRTGIASYIDLIWRDKSTFASAAQQQQWIARFLRVVPA